MISKKLQQSWMLVIAMLLISSVVLAACGGGTKEATPSPSPTTETGSQPESEPAETEAPVEESEDAVSEDQKELFKKVLGNASNLDSFSATLVADQKMNMAGTPMDTKTSMTMDVVMKPEFSFSQTMEVDAAGQKQNIESYFTPEGFFMKEPTSNQWMKFPQGMADELLQGMTNESLDPSAQLEQLTEYADKLEIEEKDDMFIIRLKASGDGFNDLINGNMESMGMSGVDVEINDMEYYIEVDKATYFPLVMKVYSDMVMGTGEGQISIVQDMTTTYTNHNNISKIDVPEEALNAPSLDGL